MNWVVVSVLCLDNTRMVTAVVVPIAFYPCSLTVWAGIDLAMTPLELEEIVDAADAVAEDHPG